MAHRSTLAAVLIACFGVSSASAHDCGQGKALAGLCRVVHGRLTLGAGTPGFRIWPIGTRRLLGVLDGYGQDETGEVIPSNVRKLIVPSGPHFVTTVYGDFEVCPLTQQREGWMQMVCVKSATGLRPVAHR